MHRYKGSQALAVILHFFRFFLSCTNEIISIPVSLSTDFPLTWWFDLVEFLLNTLLLLFRRESSDDYEIRTRVSLARSAVLMAKVIAAQQKRPKSERAREMKEMSDNSIYFIISSSWEMPRCLPFFSSPCLLALLLATNVWLSHSKQQTVAFDQFVTATQWWEKIFYVLKTW